MKDKEHLSNSIKRSYNDFLKSIDALFTEAFQNFHPSHMFTPPIPVEMYEMDKEVIIEAQLPNVKKEQIHLTIFENIIRISIKNEEYTEKRDDQTASIAKAQTLHINERTIALPFPVDEKSVKASYKDNLLTIRVPNQQKKINIE